MSSDTLLNGSVMAVIAIALVFDDDERQPGAAAGPEAEASLAPSGNNKAPRGEVEN
jgi:hypothetical protein